MRSAEHRPVSRLTPAPVRSPRTGGCRQRFAADVRIGFRRARVDTVLGLSVTPSAVGLVLVEGQDAEGSTVDREAFEIVSGRHATPRQASEQAAAAVLRTEAIAA